MESLKSMLVAVSALRTQAEYMRDVADDLAYTLAGLNRDPGCDEPIQLYDEELGYDFREVYMPGHPAADARGYVKAEDFAVSYPVEPSDTQIAYEAQLEAMKDALEAELPAGTEELPDEDDDHMIAVYG
jgi:flagellar basal body rod protein FlgC